MPKITITNLQPNPWQKMLVKFAAQIFGKSVSDTIETSVQTGQLNSIIAKDTAEFISQINVNFDCLNSKNLCNKNPNRRPVSDSNFHIFNILEKLD